MAEIIPFEPDADYTDEGKSNIARCAFSSGTSFSGMCFFVLIPARSCDFFYGFYFWECLF